MIFISSQYVAHPFVKMTTSEDEGGGARSLHQGGNWEHLFLSWFEKKNIDSRFIHIKLLNRKDLVNCKYTIFLTYYTDIY